MMHQLLPAGPAADVVCLPPDCELALTARARDERWATRRHIPRGGTRMPDALDPARRIVLTGAAGGIGRMTRPLLAKLYPGLVLSDRIEPKNLLPGERFVAADL